MHPRHRLSLNLETMKEDMNSGPNPEVLANDLECWHESDDV